MREGVGNGIKWFCGLLGVKELLNNGFRVIGLDDLDPYYDVNIKVAREKVLEEYAVSVCFGVGWRWRGCCRI